MNDVFSAEDASAIARDITIDLSEAVAGTSLECEQGGVYQSTPWSTASVHIRRQIEGDKLTIETVFDTQLAINTGRRLSTWCLQNYIAWNCLFQ